MYTSAAINFWNATGVDIGARHAYKEYKYMAWYFRGVTKKESDV